MKDTPPRGGNTQGAFSSPIAQASASSSAQEAHSPGESLRGRLGSADSSDALLAEQAQSGKQHKSGWNSLRSDSPGGQFPPALHVAGTGGTGDAASTATSPPLSGGGGVVTDPAEVRKAKLLVFALAVQHVPEALACGVAFAAVATHQDTDGDGATLGAALSLTLAIGLQDIPEGAMAAFVLRNLGWSRWDSFLYGQATGLVQPLAGVLGAAAVLGVRSILPYALAFASAAMLFVVVKDMVPDVLGGSSSRNALTLIMMGAFVFMAVASSLIDQVKL